MPPPSEHSGGGGVGWDIGLGEWVGVFMTSEFVTRPKKKQKARKKRFTHTFSMVVFL